MKKTELYYSQFRFFVLVSVSIQFNSKPPKPNKNDPITSELTFVAKLPKIISTHNISVSLLEI